MKRAIIRIMSPIDRGFSVINIRVELMRIIDIMREGIIYRCGGTTSEDSKSCMIYIGSSSVDT